MSLADHSQQWYPTSVQVTVFQARNIRIKGKNGTNDAYAIIQVAKDKFSTSVVEKCVSPVWKEEASFDLPLFHHGNAERCTLYIVVMHRALVGLDRLLGQAVINLLELHDNTSRKKTEWFKLLDKNGKPDKDRGEVLLDIQFTRNNLTASMFDLSMQEKPRSSVARLKDKLRGKKKDGFSDSASAIVPSVTQVLSDSETEDDGQTGTPGAKKSKLKSLFGPKSNLRRNVSQSMSTLGSLPEKNSSLSASRTSGLNVDSPDVKKKFKFLGHKRSGSTESKSSLGPFSLLGRSKQSAIEQSNVCINGSHVYTEEPEPPKAGLVLSLQGSGQGSVEDLYQLQERSNLDVSADSLRGLSLPSYRVESRQKALQEVEEEEGRQAMESSKAEAQRLEEEQEKRKWEELEKKEQEEATQAEERQRQQELKQAEEARVSERLSSLFGIGRKKEEQPEKPPVANREMGMPKPDSMGLTEVHLSQPSSNPFEEIPLSPEPQYPSEESHSESQRGVTCPQGPSSSFPSRTTKVSAVKPRLSMSLEAETNKGLAPSPPTNADSLSKCPPISSPSPNSSLINSPVEPFNMFSNLHSSMAPPMTRRNSNNSGSTENLIFADTSASKKKRAPPPPGPQTSSGYTNLTSANGTANVIPALTETPASTAEKPQPAPRSLSAQTAAAKGYLHPILESVTAENKEVLNIKQKTCPSLPFPDYDSIYPKKKHGVQGQMRWDEVVAEVNMRQKESREMSVDDFVRDAMHDAKSVIPFEKTGSLNQKDSGEQPFYTFKRTGTSTKQAIAPPLPPSKVFGVTTCTVQIHDALLEKPQTLVKDEGKVLNASVSVSSSKTLPLTENPKSLGKFSLVSSSSEKKPSTRSANLPPVKPRQRPMTKGPESVDQAEENSGMAVPQRSKLEVRDAKVLETKVPGDGALNEATSIKNGSIHLAKDTKLFNNEVRYSPDRFVKTNDMAELFEVSTAEGKLTDPDPFPNNVLLNDPWTKFGVDDLFSVVPKRDKKVDKQLMTADDIEKIFASKDEIDPFADFSHSCFAKPLENKLIGKRLAPLSKSSPDKEIGKSDQDKLSRVYKDPSISVSVGEPEKQKWVSLGGKDNSLMPQRGERLVEYPSSFPSPVPSSLENSKTAVGEGPAQLCVAPGGKTQSRAWVSTLEAQLITEQSSSGGGAIGKGGMPTLTLRRPHPVKPMTSLESQPPTGTLAGRDGKLVRITKNTLEKIKVTGTAENGPYTQLTQEELITLVVKQQAELSKKESKIQELEEYIDNLLVRVIEEKPSLLMSIGTAKMAL